MTAGFLPTSEQQAVISHPLSPLRVLAGAGTGKTTTIVHRILAAVRRGLDPEQVLGITFTNKAAGELADRVRVALPALVAAGREVEVATYHGFAHGILREFGALVGVPHDAEILDPGRRRQLLEQALRRGRYTELDLTAPAVRLGEMATLLRHLSDNLMTPGDLRASAPPPTARDEVWRRRLELTAALEAYEAAKRRLGLLDHGDLVRLAHRLVVENPEVARRIRERYRLVVLDEYQDTDPGQRLLLQTLFGSGFPVTAVGDPDQTIYEWRGASLENFAAFPRHFPNPDGTPATTLTLTLNRRSDRAVLRLAGAIRRRLHADDPIAELRPREEAEAGTVAVAWFRTDAEEAAWIADRIRTLHEDAGVPWREMAVLVRMNRHLPILRDALDTAGIPAEVAGVGGLLAVPEVAELHAWLRILAVPGDAPALARILLGSAYRLGLGDLAPLHRWVRAHRDAGGAAGIPDPPLLEAVDRLEEVEGLSPEARRRLEAFRQRYRELLVAAQEGSVAATCRRVLEHIGAWIEVDALPPHAARSARLDLSRFLDLAARWRPLEGHPSLEGFLSYLEALTAEGHVDELDTATVAHGDAVLLLTVHRAKGLEWDVVFLPRLTAGTFPAAPRRLDDPARGAQFLPRSLRIGNESSRHDPPTEPARRDRLVAAHEDQEWRAAHVAVTRARHRIVLSGATWGEGRRPRRPSPLLEMARALPGTLVEHLAEDREAPPSPAPRLPPPPAPDPLFPEGWAAALRAAASDPTWVARTYPELAAAVHARAERLRGEITALATPVRDPAPPAPDVTVTGLVLLAGCARRFHWAEVERLPRRPSPARRRGRRLHRRIERYYRGVPSPDDGPPAATATAARRSSGADPWGRFLASRFARVRPLHVEAPVDLRIGPGRVRGRIDAVYAPVPSHWEIVDFKSGRRSHDENRWIQLEAYALAAEEGVLRPGPPEEITLTFASLGSEPVTESRPANPDRLAAARRRIGELLERVRGRDATPTPSPACRHCDFLHLCTAGREFLAGR